MRRFLADPDAARSVVNWAEVAWSGLRRLRLQADRAPSDERLAELITLAETVLADIPPPPRPDTGLMLCPWYRIGDRVIKTTGIVARFDTAAEVTLDELRIELTYPLDATADRFFRANRYDAAPRPTAQ